MRRMKARDIPNNPIRVIQHSIQPTYEVVYLRINTAKHMAGLTLVLINAKLIHWLVHIMMSQCVRTLFFLFYINIYPLPCCPSVGWIYTSLNVFFFRSMAEERVLCVNIVWKLISRQTFSSCMSVFFLGSFLRRKYKQCTRYRSVGNKSKPLLMCLFIYLFIDSVWMNTNAHTYNNSGGHVMVALFRLQCVTELQSVQYN